MNLPESKRGRDDADRCFVCGPQNSIGLRIQFRLDDEGNCRGEFTPGSDHCGYDGITHGGIIFSALDDVMANWMFLKGLRCYTAKCEIRFKSPHPIGVPLKLTGKNLKQKRNVVVMQGTATRADNEELIAECVGTFMLTDSP